MIEVTTVVHSDAGAGYVRALIGRKDHTASAARRCPPAVRTNGLGAPNWRTGII